MVLLPLEIWLIVFRYTDATTFDAIFDFLYEKDDGFAKTLRGIVCRDIIKKNRKLILMNRLIKNPLFYRKNTTYLNFRLEYMREDYVMKFPYNKMQQSIVQQNKEANSYKYFVYSNRDLCFENVRDFNLFVHQTITRRNDSIDTVDMFNYYNNKVSVRDVFLMTKNMDINLPDY